MILNSFGGRHLTYCSNVHPGESIGEHLSQIEGQLGAIRETSGCRDALGMGMRIASLASEELADPDRLADLIQWMKERNLYLFTINGFPYGAFHQSRVKERVHEPDWATRERHDYTSRLIDILAKVLPEHLEGSISTSPITYKHGFHSGHAYEVVESQAAASLADLAWKMECHSEESGAEIHLDLEPEPDGYLETADEWIQFMNEALLREGVSRLQRTQGVTAGEADRILRRRIRLCYDTCHMALAWEEPRSVLTRLDTEGLNLGKVQLSSALAVPVPPDQAGRNALRESLEPFVEPVYLHQVIGRTADGRKRQYRDLPDALDFLDRCTEEEWRIHFHIPLFREPEAPIGSTRGHIRSLLEVLSDRKDGRHLEVETYTWDVLPERLKEGLGVSIGRELAWVRNELNQLEEERT